jgi:Tol biopolymer transport system component
VPLVGDVFLVLSDQIVRDYTLSPAADRVAFLVPGLVNGAFVSRTYIADIKGDSVTPLPSPEGLTAADQISPAWHPDGKRIAVGQLPSGGDPGRVAVVPLGGGDATLLLPPDRGFDQPLRWSPDGEYLAVKSYPGESLVDPGVPSLVFVTLGGQRIPLPEGAEIETVGWIKG